MFSPNAPSITHRAVAIGAALTVSAAALAPVAVATSGPPATILSKTIIHAGNKAPVAVPGNHLHAGQTIRKGYELIHYQIRVNGKQPLGYRNQKTITLHAPKGNIITGLAEGKDLIVGWGVHSNYKRSTLKVAFYLNPNKHDGAKKGSTYMLVKKV